MAKNQFIRARVAEWEKDCIRRKADAAHMTESEFVRRAAMDREVTVIEGMDELLRELRYQGNNLNQLTVMARQGRITQVNYVPYKIGKLQIQGFSEPTTPNKIKQSYHITQKAARSRPRAAFLRGKLGRRQDFSKK